MGTGALIVVVAVIAVAALLAVFFTTRRHPEEAAGHPDPPPDEGDATGRGALPGEVRERPAGPAAEGQNVSDPGRVDPGPSPGPPS